MAITIKQIAEICGVSRGTVDRVLNNRGKVNPETAERIRNVAKHMGYKPNLAGKALAVRKKPPCIGVIIPSEGNPFFDDVITGIRDAERELVDYGLTVNIKTMRGYDVDEQLRLIDSLSGIGILLLTPVDDDRIRSKINELHEKGISTIALNSDIGNCKRICYVGSDYYKGGMIACGMLGLLTGGVANAAVITGNNKILGHNQRIAGFREVRSSRYPGIIISASIATNDDDIVAYAETRELLDSYPDIDSLFIVAGGVYGVCRAVMDAKREENMRIVAFDDVPTTVEMIRRGLIKAVICQHPHEQGYQAVKLAFDFHITGKIPDQYVVDNEIKILEAI